ncbi:alanine racemase [Schumannella luteola]|uniref:Alanine racemase n=1 Tax=Schumannella luteola TaxID=472059 RepID=A0A852YKQ6_9MICO|nr:alanine racemase [Schumannella luteola]NYH00618.1 alanine racemase [Schumannella luteola]TPX04924.1 alanine racemase [Schumannella luteola]
MSADKPNADKPSADKPSADEPSADGRPLREIRIDAAALSHNVATLKPLVAPAQTMVVVKANAYGHGALVAARAALEGGADWLGTADLDEALALRAAAIRAPLLAWLHGPATDFRPAAEAGVDVGVSSLDQLERAAAAGAVVHLKFDTGLSRNGIQADDAPAVIARVAELQRDAGLHVRGVFSHLSGTTPEEDLAQLARFELAVAALAEAGVRPELRHLAASAAAISLPATRLDLVRLGIASYGLSPDPRVPVEPLALRPVMEVSAGIAHVKRVPAGEGVSYGYIHRTTAPTTLALVPLGYADGVPRSASGGARVAIGGVQHPVVGRIAMDQFVVDVGDAAVAVGDRAVLWGDPATGAPSAEDWADAAGTIDYEIVTRVGGRAERTIVGGLA